MNQPYQPHVFKDGRAGKFWLALYGEIEGPFESAAEAQRVLDRLHPELLSIPVVASADSQYCA